MLAHRTLCYCSIVAAGCCCRLRALYHLPIWMHVLFAMPHTHTHLHTHTHRDWFVRVIWRTEIRTEKSLFSPQNIAFLYIIGAHMAHTHTYTDEHTAATQLYVHGGTVQSVCSVAQRASQHQICGKREEVTIESLGGLSQHTKHTHTHGSMQIMHTHVC